jgi:hypothetical protein
MRTLLWVIFCLLSDDDDDDDNNNNNNNNNVSTCIVRTKGIRWMFQLRHFFFNYVFKAEDLSTKQGTVISTKRRPVSSFHTTHFGTAYSFHTTTIWSDVRSRGKSLSPVPSDPSTVRALHKKPLSHSAANYTLSDAYVSNTSSSNRKQYGCSTARWQPILL